MSTANDRAPFGQPGRQPINERLAALRGAVRGTLGLALSRRGRGPGMGMGQGMGRLAMSAIRRIRHLGASSSLVHWD